MADSYVNQSSKENPAFVETPEIPSKKKILPLRFQFALSILATIMATLLFMLIRKAFQVDISRAFLPVIAFPLNAFIVFYLFSSKLGFPFGNVKPKEYARNIGLVGSPSPLRQVSLGCILGALSLAGMLIGSVLTGKYTFIIAALTVEQVIFATVPGVWEEVFFRGVLMFVFLQKIKSVRKTMIIQSVMFGVLHFYGFQLWDIVDIFSVIIIGLAFTYTAHRTNSLIPGIVFHFLHDAFLFLVQLPDGVYSSTADNLAFYFSLWAMLGVGAIITTLITRKESWKSPIPLYTLAKLDL